ncbi:tryptophan synthase subunit alpha [Ornithinimicrobium sp. CNJ-824]|uniref:tryptophan synthase subunit alpha n=1 Tax=Ornithinimicrobium sp. CNJ-824 TaxID=1904966 RepID=UPI000963DB96|nr:tryptophan synthase subunit alpha [Ornithinimicrobium sp. CNJ-824]OLT19827.1 tryptophan synthase subunit alpha [Ornithinimicrobium sp. CNJ-824]
MSALSEVFDRCRAEGRAALVGYLPAGFPDLETSLAAVRVLAEAGADVVEVGVPYTDPLMDGPVIERAASRALAGGFRLPQVFDLVRAVREAGAVPVVMSYWNPVLHYGPERFAADLAAAGGAGMITPDLVPDEADAWLEAARAHDLDPVFLVAPSSTDARLRSTTQACRGFVYVASTMGVTGTRTTVGGSAATLVERVRAVTDLPLCVGLGVSDGAQAAEVAAFADGVIVGSALVRAVDEDPTLEGLRAVTADLAAGVRR